jgi:hypothetical protein
MIDFSHLSVKLLKMRILPNYYKRTMKNPLLRHIFVRCAIQLSQEHKKTFYCPSGKVISCSWAVGASEEIPRREGRKIIVPPLTTHMP